MVVSLQNLIASNPRKESPKVQGILYDLDSFWRRRRVPKPNLKRLSFFQQSSGLIFKEEELTKMLLETDCIKFPTKSNTQIMVILYFYFNKHLNTQKDSTISVNVCWDQIFTKAKVTNFLHLLYNNLINTLITLFLLVWISTVKRYVLWKIS